MEQITSNQMAAADAQIQSCMPEIQRQRGIQSSRCKTNKHSKDIGKLGLLRCKQRGASWCHVMLTTVNLSPMIISGSVLIIMLMQFSELHFMYQGAEETKVCGDGAGNRCVGSTDQRYEHPAEPASHASGILAADGVKGARMCKRRQLYLVWSHHCLRLACMNQLWSVGKFHNSQVTTLALCACHLDQVKRAQPQRHIPEDFIKSA